MSIYVSVSWTTGDVLTETKLDNMVANDQSETAHSANGMIMNNNVPYRAKQAGGTTKDVMKLGTDDVLRLSQIRYDDNGTPTTKENVIELTGWGFIIGDNTVNVTKAITFLPTFDTLLGVTLTPNGRKTSSDPSSITDLGGSVAPWITGTALLPTTSGFTAGLRHTDGSNLSSSDRFGFSWMAWGIKA